MSCATTTQEKYAWSIPNSMLNLGGAVHGDGQEVEGGDQDAHEDALKTLKGIRGIRNSAQLGVLPRKSLVLFLRIISLRVRHSYIVMMARFLLPLWLSLYSFRKDHHKPLISSKSRGLVSSSLDLVGLPIQNQDGQCFC